jgi:hypothetical protein
MASKKKKVAPSALPPSKVEILAEEILGHYQRCKDTGLYAVIDRSLGLHFFEVLKDGVWSYAPSIFKNKEGEIVLDGVLLAERLFMIEKCKAVKYPVYVASEETEKLIKEFSDYSSKELSREDFESAEERLRITEEYIARISSQPPELKEVERLAYVNGYNSDLGFPVIPLTEIPGEVLKSISYRLAENALSHFSTMSFLYDDNFSMIALPSVAIPDEAYDIVIGFTLESPLIYTEKR